MQNNRCMRIHQYAGKCSVNCSISHGFVLHCFLKTLILPSLRRELKLSLQLKQWSSNCDKNHFRLLNILFVVWNCICYTVIALWGWWWTPVDWKHTFPCRTFQCTDTPTWRQKWTCTNAHTVQTHIHSYYAGALLDAHTYTQTFWFKTSHGYACVCVKTKNTHSHRLSQSFNACINCTVHENPYLTKSLQSPRSVSKNPKSLLVQGDNFNLPKEFCSIGVTFRKL